MKKNGFTLAETLVTLAIIGVCAAMLITSIKNLRTDDLSNDIMAKKAITTFTEASRQVIIHNAKNNKMDELYDGDAECTSKECVFNLFAKYLNVQKVLTSAQVPENLKGDIFGLMNDGLIFGMKYDPACATTETVYPSPQGAAAGIPITNACGVFYYDVNGTKGPNAQGIDQLSVPIKKSGVRLPYAQVAETP